MPDTTIECVDCQTEFSFTENEQKFFTSKGFTAPKRCKPCREAKKQRAAGGDSYNTKY